MEHKKVSLNALTVGAFVRVAKISPAGTLEARKQKDGAVVFFWRFTYEGKSSRVQIGVYDSASPPRSIEPTALGKYSIEAAKRKAESLSIEHLDNVATQGGGYAEIQAKRTAEREAAKKELIERSEQTLSRLLEAYIETLTNNKTKKDAISTFAKHVMPHHDLINTSAAQIDDERFVDLLRGIAEQYPRTANKLRSFLMAAYNKALHARTDMDIPPLFKKFKVTVNPLTTIKPNKQGNKADKNPLSTEEMRTYWDIIKDVGGVKGATLRIHLLTGGLRPSQLLRLDRKDIRGNAFTLYDEKGVRSEPAPYITPMTAQVKKDFEALLSINTQGCIFSSNGGQTQTTRETLLDWGKGLVGNQIEGFTIKRIRSGVETLLASKGFGSDIRGLLQSHGISGVQSKHYDAHDYLPQKAQALAALSQAITEPEKTNIIKLHA